MTFTQAAIVGVRPIISWWIFIIVMFPGYAVLPLPVTAAGTDRHIMVSVGGYPIKNSLAKIFRSCFTPDYQSPSIVSPINIVYGIKDLNPILWQFPTIVIFPVATHDYSYRGVNVAFTGGSPAQRSSRPSERQGYPKFH